MSKQYETAVKRLNEYIRVGADPGPWLKAFLAFDRSSYMSIEKIPQSVRVAIMEYAEQHAPILSFGSWEMVNCYMAACRLAIAATSKTVNESVS